MDEARRTAKDRFVYRKGAKKKDKCVVKDDMMIPCGFLGEFRTSCRTGHIFLYIKHGKEKKGKEIEKKSQRKSGKLIEDLI